MKISLLWALLWLIAFFIAPIAEATNRSPIAKAGADQVVNEQTAVTLSGVNSFVHNGTIVGYRWVQTNGSPIVTLNGASTATATFTAPSLTKAAKLTFKLTVIDNRGVKDSDTMAVTIKPVNAKPVADAGDDRSVGKGVPVSLDGSRSHDSDGSIKKFGWKQTAGRPVKLIGATTATPSFTAPILLRKQQTLVFRLTVTDNENAIARDTVTITVKDVNAAPIAVAGIDQSVNEKAAVTLNGSQSQDPDGSIATYRWEQTAGPSVTLSSINTVGTGFTAPDITATTALTFKLTVTDNDGATASDMVTVTVNNVNALPTADAGIDQSVNEKAAVSLNGSQSQDPDGSIATYLWEQIAGPSTTLSSTSTASTGFTAPEVTVATDLTFKLTVTDNDGATASDTVTVTINNVNAAPTANAGIDQSIDEKTAVTLNGSQSQDPDGSITTYLWEQTAGPSVTLSANNTVSTGFTAPDITATTALTFKLTVTDNDGAQASDTVTVTLKPLLAITITAPATLTTVGTTPQTVTGTVSDPDAQVTVNGAVVANNNGQFTAAVNLDEGHNTVTARAVDNQGRDVSDVIAVSLDMTPPYITVASPKDGDTVRSGTIAVSGLVNDIVRGTVAEGQAQVSVNGIAASIANRSYLAEGINLTEGENTLNINASDNVGNTNSLRIKITYRPVAAQHIELLGGQGQSAIINATLAEPLAVKVLDDSHQPVVGKAVIFRVTEGDGVVGVGAADEGQGTLVETNAQGVAATRFKLGSRAGTGNQRVRAAAVGFDGEALFHASATVGIGNKVTVNSGNNQRGAARQPLPQPFVVAVIDDGANVVSGAPVEFKVSQGNGHFQNGLSSIISTTDSDGRATAELTLGDEEGLDVHRATATLVGTGLYAGFTASALKIGPAGDTRISGVVLDNQDQPLPNVTLRVDGTTREAQTDAQGQFTITEAPVGAVRLVADGSTTTAPGEWPTLAFNLVTIAGADNPLPAPVYLVKLDTVNAQQVGDQDVTLTLPDVPGFALEVKAGSVTFPDGNKSGRLSVTPVNASKIPMPPPNGMQPQFIVTIQPVGAKFDPPARITLPNVDGHKPGAEVEMYSYDHDLEEFVTVGLGTVSSDGSVIKSHPGTGVVKSGWFCGSLPGGGGCSFQPGECQIIVGLCTLVDLPAELDSVDAKADGKDEDIVPFEEDNTSINFTGTATGSNCNYEYKWEFGDGQSSTEQNPTHKYQKPGEYEAKLTVKCKKCGKGEKTDSIKIYVVKIELNVTNATLSLLQENILEALVTPENAPAQEFKFEIRFGSESTFYELQSDTSKAYSDKAKVAGQFKVRVSAKFPDSLEIYSDEKDLEVQFPDYNNIVGDPGVQQATDLAWDATLSDASPTQRRERGFWILLNTSTGKYEFTDTKFGPWVDDLEQAYIYSASQPVDIPSPTTPLSTPIYAVALFHTHTPTFYRTVRRPVGPSGGDLENAKATDAPYIIFDYVGDASGYAPAGWPLHSPAQLYPAGPFRRSTPP